MEQLPLGVRLKERATLASYLPSGNEQAVARLARVGRGDERGTTWLAGPVGVGKSHLLQATCSLAGSHGRSGYFPLGVIAGVLPEFIAGAGALDCVCIDDLQLVAGDAAWEHALFAVYRELETRNARLLVAAEQPPGQLGLVLADLRSRLAAAQGFVLQPLNETDQLSALRLRAHLRGLELPDETGLYLLRRFPRDMATLAELLDTLDEASLVAQRRLTVPFIRAVLEAPRRV
ncbi:MAG TPA: DnaA regulatory inactivator Hda [Steroidobacteraceae bacterium]|nr:DnaA regulatory inactivator Hda [Steroidobacteraceae bacterium]HRX90216.1 DnaA regulatory inactivator Hda [Steroidobacteraceae bacterium]